MAGLAFVANALFLAAVVALLTFTVESASVRGASPLSVRAALLAVLVLGLLALVLRGSRKANVVAALVVGALLVAGQIWLHPRRVSEYPASSTRHPVPYVMFTGLPGADDHNALGYRGREPARPKPPGEHRILVVGGSAVYGKGQPELTIPFQLQQLARRRASRDTKVYNWGVVSQVSGQELATIAHRGLAYEPDVVVLYDFANDLYASFAADPRPGHPFNFVVSERAVAIFQAGDVRALAAGLLTQSSLLRALLPLELSDATARLAPLREAAGYATPRWEEEVVSAYLGNVRSACRISAAYGARFVAALQPVVFFTPQADGYTAMGAEFRPFVERGYARARAGFAELQATEGARGCTFLDLSRACVEGECVFSDYVHPTPETRRPMVEALFVHLRDGGLLEGPQTGAP